MCWSSTSSLWMWTRFWWVSVFMVVGGCFCFFVWNGMSVVQLGAFFVAVCVCACVGEVCGWVWVSVDLP